MSDLISRQAVIDAAKKLLDYYGTNDITKEFADDIAEQFMNRVPSAQPEIIRCKDCKWKYKHNCTRAVEVFIDDDKWCAWAERRQDALN